MKNTLITIFLIASNFLAFGQEKKVNNYKYIIVPERFSFLKKNDQYKTSSLTKFLLKKNGFTVILDSEEYPLELKIDPCKALKVNVVDKSSMFKTKLIIELNNCFDNVVYSSKEGGSRHKEYKKSFQEAIRNAHESMIDLKYEALTNEAVVKQEKVISSPIMSKEVVAIKNTAVLVPSKQKEVKPSVSKDLKSSNTLYAQPTKSGFQLINLKPEVVFLILNTNLQDVFIIRDKNGLLYKKGTNWVAEFYENDKLVKKKYQIKF
ncbi:hypothetical protein CW731_14690 [Polaribacter sp. ALD11]|uniref:hypothetical protein n=1 Tax=Polaribacter sp. ALD11 TaxID=2058137 RepID=UPI000C30AA42|nr:hypothetical protein [Polaribacter sp. ALD11]AUC86450.1 hypothetical protein CW731_14690 [Polaribacter sp. ALD11]